MKFDTIIIGGGLTALTAGIALAKEQKRVAVIGSGQSTLHFSSGSFDLLGFDRGNEVKHPIEAIGELTQQHPYHKTGDVAALADEARKLLAEAGIAVKGDNKANHYRLSPIGELVPAWLTMDEMLTIGDDRQLPWKDVILANVEGFLDFQVNFLKPALEKLGAKVSIKTFTTPELEFARRSPSEFRATNIAKYLDGEEAISHVADKLNAMGSADVILLPEVLGLNDYSAIQLLRDSVKTPITFLATMHPSVAGVRVVNMLRRRFQKLGGFHFLSDIVNGSTMSDGRIACVTTHNMVEEQLEADNFVLATGSFMSRGLMSNYQSVWEPIFHLDVDAAPTRAGWHSNKFFDDQQFMTFGVKTDAELHALKDGKVISNLYAAGSVLSGHDSLSLCDHEGVDMLTALAAANNILQRRKK